MDERVEVPGVGFVSRPGGRKDQSGYASNADMAEAAMKEQFRKSRGWGGIAGASKQGRDAKAAGQDPSAYFKSEYAAWKAKRAGQKAALDALPSSGGSSGGR